MRRVQGRLVDGGRVMVDQRVFKFLMLNAYIIVNIKDIFIYFLKILPFIFNARSIVPQGSDLAHV